MKSAPHNPNYKLISVTIDNKELVYGETNDGQNKGLEVYFPKYSRRFEYNIKLPQKYIELWWNLESQIKNCLPGHKIELTNDEYRAIAVSRLKGVLV